jgi:adenine/guanine/hypoxanthine permease
MFFAPIIGMVPPQATAAALIIVGFLMISTLTELEDTAEREATGEPDDRPRRKLAGIDFSDFAIGLPAALTILLMPLSYSITNGIGFGFIAYTLIRIAQGEARRVHPLMWVSSVAFAFYFLVPLLQETFSWM